MLPENLTQLAEIGAAQVIAANLQLQREIAARDETIAARDAEIARLHAVPPIGSNADQQSAWNGVRTTYNGTPMIHEPAGAA